MKNINFNEEDLSYLTIQYLIDYVCIKLLSFKLDMLVSNALKCGKAFSKQILKLNQVINNKLYTISQYQIAIDCLSNVR